MDSYDNKPDPNQKTQADKELEEEPKDLAASWQAEAQVLQDAPNIVDWFMQFATDDVGPKWLGQLAKQVCDHFEMGRESMEPYREKRKRSFEMLTGYLPPRDSIVENGSNAHTPLMLERFLRLTSNVYVEVLADREAIFRVEPTGPDDFEDSELLTIHGNWQLKNEMPDFMRQRERDINEFFGAGSAFCKSYRDEIRNRNRHDTLSPEDFVFPYIHTTVEVDMSDVPWKAHVIRKYRAEVEDLRDAGKWSNADKVLAKDPPAWDILETKARDAGAKQEGIVAPERDKNAPYVFIEYHGFTRFPGDKNQRAVKVTVDRESKTVVHLMVNEEEDWRDRERFDQQSQELEQYNGDLQAFNQSQMQTQQLEMRLQMPDIAPEERDEITSALGAEPLEPPQLPQWAQPKAEKGEPVAPDPVKRVPVQMFSHGVCIENPFGALGIAPGHVLADLNRLADDAYNAVYDQASLGNASFFITIGDVDFGSSQVPIGSGKILRLKNVSADGIDKVLKEIKPSPANPQLMDIVRLAKEDGDASVAAPGVLSGEPGKSGETFRGLATRHEAAKRQLSKAAMKYLDYFANILKNNARLNYHFMPDEEAIQVLDHFSEIRSATLDENGMPRPVVHIGRELYRRNYKVSFTADVSFAPQAQRISEADELVAMGQTPALAGNIPFNYHAYANALKARRKHDMLPFLGPPPPPPETPLGIPPPPPPGMVGPDGVPMDPAMGGMPPEAGGPPPGVQMPAAAPGPIQGPRAEGE